VVLPPTGAYHDLATVAVKCRVRCTEGRSCLTPCRPSQGSNESGAAAVDQDGPAAGIDPVDSGDDDDGVRELFEVEDRDLIQELLGDEMRFAKSRGATREYIAYLAIARYHEFISNPTESEHRVAASLH
jgi:hypothetical protein